MTRDATLSRLLVTELERHLVVLAAEEVDLEGTRRAVHALKGSAGLAGEPELAAALTRLERRLREGDSQARAATAALVRSAAARIQNGESAIEASWPTPPDDLAPRPIDPHMSAQYMAATKDRLAQIDEALGSLGEPTDEARSVFRHVHTIKGAASAAGDEPMVWFCHGLEERLRGGDASDDAARLALSEVARWRGVLGGLMDDAESALASLRHDVPRASVRPGTGHRSSLRPTTARPHPRGDDEARDGDATVRVPQANVERLFGQLAALRGVREHLETNSSAARGEAQQLRELRAELADALRLIGPPRPWGAPAAALRKIEHSAHALLNLADGLERLALDVSSGSAILRERSREAQHEVATMLQTPVRGIFERVTQAVQAEAARTGKVVHVAMHGADAPIDRRIAEALAEPLLQLARNSLAHGIEAPEVRAAKGKTPIATLTLAARKAGPRLVVSVSDDGAGVDVERVRARALEAGEVTEGLLLGVNDDVLLELLLLPGFSTHENADFLAGRGIGLDIVLASVAKIGGALRLASRHGEGFTARLDVPIETGFARALWVRADGSEYAVLASSIVQVRAASAHEDPPHLSACLEPKTPGPSAFVLDLAIEEAEGAPFSVGVDAVLRVEEVLVRPLSPLVAGIGPFAGAVVKPDGTLALALDALGLLPRARALSTRTQLRPSDAPTDHASKRPVA